MAYSPYTAHTPQSTRSTRTRTSSSSPSTPRLGYTTADTRPCNHHYAGLLGQPDSSNSDSYSVAGYVTPAHKSPQAASYGTLQTDISIGTPKAKQLVVELSTPNDHDTMQTVTLRKPVAWVWASINMIICGLCTFSLLQPYWLISSTTNASLGIINYCEGRATPDIPLDQCEYYLQSSSPALTLSSLPWRAVVILYIVVCTLNAMGGVLAALCLCTTNISTIHRLSLVAGFQQLTAAVLLLTLLAIFPVGLDDPEVQKMCGLESHIYFTGSCKLGWSYILSAACCVASFTLPVLSHYITHVPAYNHLLPYYAN